MAWICYLPVMGDRDATADVRVEDLQLRLRETRDDLRAIGREAQEMGRRVTALENRAGIVTGWAVVSVTAAIVSILMVAFAGG